MIYIVSDTHFYHKNILQYCDRPYKTVEEMNLAIVNNWNSVVTPNDIVFHLGDVGFGLVENLKPMIESLNGHKILLKGNHDMKRGENSWRNIGFEKSYKCKEVTLRQFLNDIGYLDDSEIKNYTGNLENVIFSHYPRECLDNQINIHGHIHDVPLDTSLYNPNNHICVSVEMINYKPKSLREILAEHQ